jgi:hypothetical protein
MPHLPRPGFRRGRLWAIIRAVASHDRFRRFREAVLADAELQSSLRAIGDWDAFRAAAVDAAARRALPLSGEDLDAAREECRRSWREHWV